MQAVQNVMKAKVSTVSKYEAVNPNWHVTSRQNELLFCAQCCESCVDHKLFITVSTSLIFLLFIDDSLDSFRLASCSSATLCPDDIFHGRIGFLLSPTDTTTVVGERLLLRGRWKGFLRPRFNLTVPSVTWTFLYVPLLEIVMRDLPLSYKMAWIWGEDITERGKQERRG